jgi:DNA end-binding protein Ku
MANQLIESMAQDWKPSRYRDTYTERVNDLIEAKRKGNDVQVGDDAPEPTNVIDLVEALRRSVDSAKNPRRRSAASTKNTAKKSTAKKSTAKKTAKKTAKRSGKKAAAKKAS